MSVTEAVSQVDRSWLNDDVGILQLGTNIKFGRSAIEEDQSALIGRTGSCLANLETRC